MVLQHAPHSSNSRMKVTDIDVRKLMTFLLYEKQFYSGFIVYNCFCQNLKDSTQFHHSLVKDYFSFSYAISIFSTHLIIINCQYFCAFSKTCLICFVRTVIEQDNTTFFFNKKFEFTFRTQICFSLFIFIYYNTFTTFELDMTNSIL